MAETKKKTTKKQTKKNTKSTSKEDKTIKELKKVKKKHPKLFFTLVLLVIIGVAVVGALWYFGYIELPFMKKETQQLVSSEQKEYEFDKNTSKMYSVSYDETSKTYTRGEEASTLKSGDAYVILTESEGRYIMYSLDDKGELVQKEEATSAIAFESVFVYLGTKNEKEVFAGNPKDKIVESVTYEGFEIHFMTLGNDAAGDSIYIKAGDTDILIDAGSRSNSFETTSQYINKYCKDKKLEYVIATHGDQDHIDAFPKFADAYDFGTIISTRYTTKSTQTYKKMITAFEQEVSSGAKWYYTDDCWNNANGAKRSYQLSSNVTMSILYNYYYFDNDKDGSGDSKDENNYSVSTMFTYTRDNGEAFNFMFTGDLEKEGEIKMSEYYDGSSKEKTLPTVALFKAGHHGSKTSSNDCLLSLIKPKMCVISCCCGTNEYTGITDNQFPTQAFIDRIAKYTDRVYATSVYESFTIETKAEGQNVPGVEVGKQYIKSSGFKALNGNVVVSCNSNYVGIHASNNLVKLKNSDWFNTEITIDGEKRKMRTWPSA